jgi:hypothetical protein
MKSNVQIGEAVVVALKRNESGPIICKFDDFKLNPMGLVMAKLKGRRVGGKYEVGILHNWFGLYGLMEVSEAALGIPIRVRTNKGPVYGAVPWETNFAAPNVEAYTELGPISVSAEAIEVIRSWMDE